jgi:hypothetical protein
MIRTTLEFAIMEHSTTLAVRLPNRRLLNELERQIIVRRLACERSVRRSKVVIEFLSNPLDSFRAGL